MKTVDVAHPLGDLEVVDYMAQPKAAQDFADLVETLCSNNRRRLGYKGYFNTNGDGILTAFLAGLKAGAKGDWIPEVPQNKRVCVRQKRRACAAP